MTLTNRILATLIMLAAGIIFCGANSQALAQATTVTSTATVPVPPTTVSCAGDTVTFTGRMHVLIHVTNDASGGRHTVLQINTQGVRGVGLTGAQYVANTTVHETLTDPQTVDGKLVYTSTAKYLVIGQGRNPDFIVRMKTHLTVDDDGTATPSTPTFEIDCR
ncbi:MAG TPA: hypothetical protein VEY09_07885 [Pyrinomonadaceae bacterium]|nr:hypothetical protein [Pyrinomonadaceae bacterium]